MMDASIGGAVMHRMMPDIAQGAMPGQHGVGQGVAGSAGRSAPTVSAPADYLADPTLAGRPGW